MFELSPQLSADTVPVAQWSLCQVLLMKDANYPWLILVPQRHGVTEIHELDENDRATLIQEIARASHRLQIATNAHKINVAALGNVVPQLHVHVIARFPTDAAWPGPVWGKCPPKPYGDAEIAELLGKLI